MSKEKDARKNISAMHRLIKSHHLSLIKNAEEIDMMKGIIALSYLNTGQFYEFNSYINSIKNKFNQTSYLNMASERLLKEKKNLNIAEAMSKKTLILYKSFKNDPAAKPLNYTISDWSRFMRMAAYPYYYTYAAILHANSKDKLALYYLEKAIKSQKAEPLNDETTELYTSLLVSAGQYNKAYDSLYAKAKIGKASVPMMTLLKKLYVKKGNTLIKANFFIDSLQRAADKSFFEEVTKRMIVGKRAPDFELIDVNGNHVSLSQFRGKTVVLDFWATWCAPCKASMPAMKQLTQKYPDVVFLFIATQETSKDVAMRIKAYLKKQSFDFCVLVDQTSAEDPKKYTAAAAYQIDGIPAKVVIDRDGNELFLTSGYTSNTELIRDMDVMITIAKSR